MKKKFLILSLLLFFIFSSYIYFFHLRSVDKNNPMIAIPADASIIVQLENPFKEWQSVTENLIWNYLKTNSYFKELGTELDALSEDMKTNEAVYELLIGRPLVFSVHKTRKDDYDFLYSIDLQRATQLNFLKNYINDLSGAIDKVFTRDYNGIEITEIHFKESKTPYYLYLHKNLLCISSTHTIIERSIDQLKKPQITRDLNFIDISNELGNNAVNLYFNHKAFKEYLGIWIDDKESLSYFDQVSYSGLGLEASDKTINLTGYSKLTSADSSLITALLNSGQAEVTVGSIVPDNASYFMSLGFEDANVFYSQMEDILRSDEETSSYLTTKQKIENYLNISFREDFLSWIDQEIALIQLNSSSRKNEINLAVAIKHSDLDLVKEKLDYISKQIRKKTPVKFKGITYKGYDIKFLSIKGFFKLILGNTFEDIEKPYYTILDEYVVFSNTPRTLGKIITAVQSESTLSEREEYVQFLNKFEDESNIFVYLSAEELVYDLKRLTDKTSWKSLKPHIPYFKSFPMMGAQLSGSDQMIYHEFQFNYFNHNQMKKWNLMVEESTTTSKNAINTLSGDTITQEDYIQVEEILPEDLTSDSFVEYFSNGAVKFEVSLKDGLKHGRYYQYDSLGNLLVKGRYRDDEKSGKWKFYDSEGNLVEKKRY